jgi:hypothetical protein
MMPVNILYISDCQLPIADLRLELEVAQKHYDQSNQNTGNDDRQIEDQHPDWFSLEREAE